MHAFLYAISHLDMLDVSRDLRVDGLEIYAGTLLEKVFVVLVENVVLHAAGATRISLQYRETDDGAGIPQHLKEQMFERRFEEKPGIGLFLARAFLSIADIAIRETGEPEGGARFEMLVPKGAYRFVEGAE